MEIYDFVQQFYLDNVILAFTTKSTMSKKINNFSSYLFEGCA